MDLGHHRARCEICNSTRSAEIADLYLDTASVIETAQISGFEVWTVRRHVKALGLRAQLLNDTLGTNQKLIERGLELLSMGKLDINGPVMAQLLRLQAELRKELDTRDPLFIVLQQVDPEARQALAESIKNRFIDVGNQDN